MSDVLIEINLSIQKFKAIKAHSLIEWAFYFIFVIDYFYFLYCILVETSLDPSVYLGLTKVYYLDDIFKIN